MVVLPNSVDPEEWATGPAACDGVRVGWTGSPTHFEDLAVALDAVRELQKKHAFTFVMQGICNRADPGRAFADPVWRTWARRIFATPLGKAIKRFLDKMSGIRYEFHPNVPVDRARAEGLRARLGYRNRSADRRPLQPPQELHQVLRIRDVGCGYRGVERASVFDGSPDHREE